MICSKCGIDKPEESFAFKNKAKLKRHTICKECQRAYKLKHYYSNKEAHYERNKKTLNKISDFILEYKKNHPCCICGESTPECLDFHHLHGKTGEIARLRRGGSLDKVRNEIKKCIVLCANCHRKIHAGIIKMPED